MAVEQKMIPAVSDVKVNGSIVSAKMQSNQKEMIISDNLYNTYVLDLATKSFTVTFNLTRDAESLHRFSKGLAASSNGFVNAFVSKTTVNSILKYTGRSIEKNMQLKWHVSDVSKSYFSKDDKYYISGGEDGRTIIHQLPSFNMIASLPYMPDYISSIDMSTDQTKLLISAMDKKTMIFDFNNYQELSEFSTPDYIEHAKFIGDGNRIFYVQKNGDIGIFDIAEDEIINTSNITNAWITTFELMHDDKFAIIGTRENTLYVINTEDLIEMFIFKLDYVGTTNIVFIDDNTLLLSFSNGNIQIFDINIEVEKMQSFLDENNFSQAVSVTDDNPFLRLREDFQQVMSDNWPKYFEEAKAMILENRIAPATTLAKPFLGDHKRNTEFTNFLKQKEAIVKFLKAAEFNNIKDAYLIADKNPEIEQLDAFKEMETKWNKTFKAAKQLLSQDPKGNLQKAQTILNPYFMVNRKRSAVGNFLDNYTKYTEADQLLLAQDFSGYFRLAERFTFLKETDVYQRALLVGQKLADKIAMFEGDKKFDEAISLCDVLITMLPFIELAKQKRKSIEQKKAFLAAIAGNNLEEAFTLSQAVPEIKAMPEYVQINNEFNQAISEAMQIAADGKPEETMAKLGKYMDMKVFKKKIASIMQSAYLYEIIKHGQQYHDFNDPQKQLEFSQLKPSEQKRIKSEMVEVAWVPTLTQFVERFGRTGELQKVCTNFEITGFLEAIDESNDKPFGYADTPYIKTVIMQEVK